MTDRYAVIGHPVDHSKSPEIHAAFAAQTGEDLVYDLLPAPRDGFTETAAHFFAEGGAGLNVTVPFKAEAARFADLLTDRAEAADAVNTLMRLPDGRREGDNTDGHGLVRDLTVNLGLALGGRRILLLGAGGAARGVLGPLLAESPSRVVVANRTATRAVDLAHRFADRGPATGVGFEDINAQAPFDLLINATAAGLGGDVPTLPDGLFAPGGTAYDMVYGDTPTAFVRWALDHGAASASDGLGMLVEQAAESFRVWRGVRPDTAPVLHRLRGGANS
ncbi:shikimate dehydrogenase [Salinisphaera sp. PC39]|uniref:shikimate dehydrogenase n=1 Tax=Salinisphaera sp. PC39 TaxID=1304156 RepID=UPI00333FCD93